MDPWVAGVLGGLVSGVVGGVLSGIAVHEYQSHRHATSSRLAAIREVRAAFGDLRAYLAEATPNGLNAVERDNLVAALDVLRDTLLRNSTHFVAALVDEVQARTARLRGLVLHISLDDATALQGLAEPMLALQGVMPSE